MSQSSAARPAARPATEPVSGPVDGAGSVGREVLSALDDADCRAILDATGDDALSAREVSETCDLPLSTAYRKLDLLTDAGLLEERTRLRRSGKHASEYVRRVEEVAISVAGDGLELEVVPREGAGSAPAYAPALGSR